MQSSLLDSQKFKQNQNNQKRQIASKRDIHQVRQLTETVVQQKAHVDQAIFLKL